MSGIYGIIGCALVIGAMIFGFGLLVGAMLYHKCIKSASKLMWQVDKGEVPGVDTGTVEQEYAD